MKYLGIDYGESKVGLAIGDDESHLSLPYQIIQKATREKLFQVINDIIKAESIGLVVVGLPINTIGEPSAQTEIVKKFTGELKEKVAIEVVFQDERFSSAEAHKLGAGTREFRRDKRDDDVAAMIMLQSYLDANA